MRLIGDKPRIPPALAVILCLLSSLAGLGLWLAGVEWSGLFGALAFVLVSPLVLGRPAAQTGTGRERRDPRG